MHRDFKLENIFMHNEEVVIGDFGLSKIAGSKKEHTFVGSPATMAPELLFH